jgi:hypothetical protein
VRDGEALSACSSVSVARCRADEVLVWTFRRRWSRFPDPTIRIPSPHCCRFAHDLVKESVISRAEPA